MILLYLKIIIISLFLKLSFPMIQANLTFLFIARLQVNCFQNLSILSTTMTIIVKPKKEISCDMCGKTMLKNIIQHKTTDKCRLTHFIQQAELNLKEDVTVQ